MTIPRLALAASLLGLTAAMGFPAAAWADCIPSALSDSAHNVCIGRYALGNNNGTANTATGYAALYSNTTGSDNTASGNGALYSNTTGNSNTASGNGALNNNATGNSNTASGYSALISNITGSSNTATGNLAGGKQTGSNNTTLGAEAGWLGVSGDGLNLTGSNNIALGYRAGSQWGSNNAAASNNIAIGNAGTAADAGTIRIGTPGVQLSAYIAGIATAKIKKGAAVLVDANGMLGTKKSSIRYKQDVQDMGGASAPLMQLRPVTFRYKEAEPDGSKPIQYGLIAEEVEKVMPDLVIYNDKGTPETVDYESLPSLLLNEMQKQDRELASTKAVLAETRIALAAAQDGLAAANARASTSDARLAAAEAKSQSMEAELAALKLAVSRLAAAQSGTTFAAATP